MQSFLPPCLPVHKFTLTCSLLKCYFHQLTLIAHSPLTRLISAILPIYLYEMTTNKSEQLIVIPSWQNNYRMLLFSFSPFTVLHMAHKVSYHIHSKALCICNPKEGLPVPYVSHFSLLIDKIPDRNNLWEETLIWLRISHDGGNNLKDCILEGCMVKVS